MRLKELQSLLQDIRGFDTPKQHLEQYITGPHIAAGILHTIAQSYEDLEKSVVVDLGSGTVCTDACLNTSEAMMMLRYHESYQLSKQCTSTVVGALCCFEYDFGPAAAFTACHPHCRPARAPAGMQGMLGIGCALLGCPHVIGLEVDTEALQQAAANAAAFEALPIDWVQMDVAHMRGTADFNRLHADIVVSNPPFGVWHKGADTAFLTAAFEISTSTVYSLHKASTRAYVERLAVDALHATSAAIVTELRYDLPATYKHHRHKSKDVRVDLWRFAV